MERERNLDFDKVIERRDTDSLKYDFAVRRGKPADVLPLWVADPPPFASRTLWSVAFWLERLVGRCTLSTFVCCLSTLLS